MTIRDRLARLEAGLPALSSRARDDSAARLVDRLAAIAAQFEPGAASMTFADLMAESPAVHVSWALRFNPDDASVKAVLLSRGWRVDGDTASAPGRLA